MFIKINFTLYPSKTIKENTVVIKQMFVCFCSHVKTNYKLIKN